MSEKVERAGKFLLFVASCLEKPGKCRPSGGKWRQVARRFAGIFQIFPLPLYPENLFYRVFGPRGAQKAPFDRKNSPHRPTPASDLPDLP